MPGLGSHVISAFKARDGNNIWLRDFLPDNIPTARVLVYRYNTAITKGDSKHTINSLAIVFLDSINAFRATIKVTLYNRSAQTFLLI